MRSIAFLESARWWKTCECERSRRRVLGCGIALWISAIAPIQIHALLITTTSGDLVFEFIDGKGGTSTQEFGMETPSSSSTIAERDVIFVVELVSETVASVSPSSIVNFGFFPAASVLDFYNVSSFGGTFFAFSSSLGGSPTARDLVVFTDTNNSLGFGGSAVETVGVDDWILHLDDAASISFDDDDNELVISVRVVALPEPGTISLFVLGLMPSLSFCVSVVLSFGGRVAAHRVVSKSPGSF